MVVLLLIVTGDGRVRSEWNSALLSDCVAPAYALLLTSATEIVVWCLKRVCGTWKRVFGILKSVVRYFQEGNVVL